MTDKTYTIAGVSFHKGAYKVRFANDIMRTKILQKNGHSDITLETLPAALNKREAVAHLVSVGVGQGNTDITEALAAATKKYAARNTKAASDISTLEIVE
jgi:hypothetical protein